MTHFYSEEKRGFYAEDLREVFEEAGTWPADAKPLTDEQYKEFYEVIVAGGKTIKFDKKGVPKIIDLPAKELKEVNTHNERAWRNAELDRADTQLKIAEDGDGVGTVEEWREYRKSLRKWPEDKKFPDSSFRPKAPDAEVTNA